VDREEFMSEVVRLLLRQLERCDDVEGGLFEIDGDEGGAFLRNLLAKLRRSVDEIVENGAESMVKTELDKLEAWVKEEYDWELRRESIVRRGMIRLEDGEEVEMEMDDNDEDEETGEYAPLVIDLDEGSTMHEEIEDEGTPDIDDMRY
jgi:A1 cistron-splicing factor AAR2